jgi:hypothetical protein
VFVTGRPTLALSDGATATYASGSGGNTLTFNYTVATGETTNGNKLDYASANALTLNGGTILDSLNNPANLTLPAPGAAGSLSANKTIVINAVQPAVTGISSPIANGTYGVTTTIPITVTFTTAVVVTGTPKLALSDGGTASYASGSGTAVLTFNYTPAYGETTNGNKLDYASANALSLNGGTINDVLNNPANLTLPAPGAANSLSANKSIIIDAVAPTVVHYEVLFGSQVYDLTGSNRVRLPWQITGIRAVFSKTIGSANVNSLGGIVATAVSGVGTNTVTWTIPPTALGSFATTLAGSGGNAVTDALGNALSAGAGFAQTLNVLMGDFNDDGLVNAQDMVLVYAATAQPYNIFADINGDGVVDINDVTAVRTRLGTHLP